MELQEIPDYLENAMASIGLTIHPDDGDDFEIETDLLSYIKRESLILTMYNATSTRNQYSLFDGRFNYKTYRNKVISDIILALNRRVKNEYDIVPGEEALDKLAESGFKFLKKLESTYGKVKLYIAFGKLHISDV